MHRGLLIAGLLGLASACQANVIGYDGFDYTAGANLVGQNGGYLWSAGWVANGAIATPVIGSGDMTYSSGSVTLLTAGNKVGAGNSKSALRLINFTPSTGSALWIAFRQNQTAASFPGNNAGFALESTSDGSSGVEFFMGNPGFSGTNYGYNYSQGSTTFRQNGGTVSAANKDALLVYKLDYQATGTVVSMWVNPTTTSEAALGATYQPTSTVTGALATSAWHSVKFNTGSAATGWTMDELRLGTSYADVMTVPEPAAIGLLGSAGLLLVGNRRRVAAK